MDKNTLQIVRAVLHNKDVRAFAHQKLSVTGATPQALTVPDGALYADIAVESADTGVVIRYLNYPNCTPTTSIGMPLSNGDKFNIVTGDDLVNFRCIAVSGTQTLTIQYYK